MEAVKDTVSPLDYQYVVLKTEKLTSAVHLVTGFMSDMNPIKWKLRDKALSVLTTALELRSGSDLYRLSVMDNMVKEIEMIKSFISVSQTDGSVSQMNLSVINQEYANLLSYIEKSNTGRSSELVGSYLAPAVTTPSPYKIGPASSGQASHSVARSQLVKTAFSGSNNPAVAAINGRRQQITDYVSNHGWSAINDIAKAVPGVSDKTVQRELAAMVVEGLLIKKGDRRWSRYQLAGKA